MLAFARKAPYVGLLWCKITVETLSEPLKEDWTTAPQINKENSEKGEMKYLQPADPTLCAFFPMPPAPSMLFVECAIAKTAQHRIKHRVKL